MGMLQQQGEKKPARNGQRDVITDRVEAIMVPNKAQTLPHRLVLT